MSDARFEDGREAPLNLGALDGDDLKVLAALAQDAVFPGSEMQWLPKERRFALLLNRFRWEDRAGAEARGVENAGEIVAAFAANLEKWEAIIAEQGTEDYAGLLWDEIYSKVDY